MGSRAPALSSLATNRPTRPCCCCRPPPLLLLLLPIHVAVAAAHHTAAAASHLPPPRLPLPSFEEARAKRGGSTAELAYEFVDTPSLGLEEWREPREYDAVTCMFAIHYFFVSERALKQVRAGGRAVGGRESGEALRMCAVCSGCLSRLCAVWSAAAIPPPAIPTTCLPSPHACTAPPPCLQFLSNVALNLKPGGYFFGTVPDGKMINACIKRGKARTHMLCILSRGHRASLTCAETKQQVFGDRLFVTCLVFATHGPPGAGV